MQLQKMPDLPNPTWHRTVTSPSARGGEATREPPGWVPGKKRPVLSLLGRKGAHGSRAPCSQGVRLQAWWRLAAAFLLLWPGSMFPVKPGASTAWLWAFWRAPGMASHLNHSWLQFTGNHGQPLLLYSFVYSLCSLRLNSSWFMSAWCQSKLFSLDLCWNLILQTVTVCYCRLVIFVFLTHAALVCFM